MSNIYTTLECNLGEGTKKYLFTGNDIFSKVEAREVDEAGNVMYVDRGISIPINHYKEIRRDNKPYRSGTFFQKGT